MYISASNIHGYVCFFGFEMYPVAAVCLRSGSIRIAVLVATNRLQCSIFTQAVTPRLPLSTLPAKIVGILSLVRPPRVAI